MNHHKRTILIVDDEEDLLLVLQDFLSVNFTVFIATDGDKALELIHQKGETIELVITDIDMPAMNGIELLKHLRASYPTIGVMMLSGQGNVQTAIDAMKLGACDYITKPIIVFEELDVRINNYFEKQKLEHRLTEFMKLRDELMSQVKTFTFLSLDVVDSHRLKQGADLLLAQYSFMEYHKLVRTIVEEAKGKINSTAGDGIMCSFISAQIAVNTAQTIKNQLHTFNQQKNKLLLPFRLRFGIHTGSAIIDTEGKVEQSYGGVLDIAGHIQKNAAENEICISQETFEELSDKKNVSPLNLTVDGIQVYKLSQ
jgi:DNA-binding response OmpR family regulator